MKEKGNPNIKILSPYINANTKVECQCLNNSEHPNWFAKPTDLLYGHGCKKCGILKRIEIRKTSFSDIIKYLQKEKINLLSEEEEYKNNRSPLKLQCQKCDTEWISCLQNISRNSINCPNCRKIHNITSYGIFIKKVYENRPEIEILSSEQEYINSIISNLKIKVKCKKCNNIYQLSPRSLLTKNKTEKCYNCFLIEQKIKNKQNFLDKISILNNNLEIVNMENFERQDSYITIHCKKCNSEWSIKGESLLANKCTCYTCNSSKGEKEVSRVLSLLNIKFFSQYKFEGCKDTRPLPFDFYLPDYNCLIEYDGEQHFIDIPHFRKKDDSITSLEKIQKHDDIKNKYCIKNNIYLLRIKYTEINNIENIIKNFLSKER